MVCFFNDPREMLFYFLQDIAFIPIQILIVTIIIEQVLASRDQQALLKKMNMVIGDFFSECGTELIRILTSFDPENKKTKDFALINNDTNDKDFVRIQKSKKLLDPKIDSSISDLNLLKTFLAS